MCIQMMGLTFHVVVWYTVYYEYVNKCLINFVRDYNGPIIHHVEI
jgi:hypothetical protein